MLLFEWDPQKATRNLALHGVSFNEATVAFGDTHSRTVPDPKHSQDEERFILLGETRHGRLVVVVHTFRGIRVRLISARLATKAERRLYEEGNTRS